MVIWNWYRVLKIYSFHMYHCPVWLWKGGLRYWNPLYINHQYLPISIEMPSSGKAENLKLWVVTSNDGSAEKSNASHYYYYESKIVMRLKISRSLLLLWIKNSYEIENLHLITIDMSLLSLGRLEYRVDRLCFCGTIRPAKVRISSYE